MTDPTDSLIARCGAGNRKKSDGLVLNYLRYFATGWR